MEPEAEFRKQVKDALEHLYDTAFLETLPLLAQFPSQAAASSLTRAQKLRGLLKETIEALRPQEGSPSGSPEWRSYLALRCRFVQGMTPGETQMELGISLRQLQRELHKGLDAVTVLLWEKRMAAPTAPAPPAPGDMQTLQTELAQWQLARQNCEMRGLVDDALWMLKPLLDERGLTVRTDLPETLAPVFVDATLTRQALFRLARLFARSSAKGSMALVVREGKKHTEVSLTSPEAIQVESEEDWLTARAICQQQGVDVTVAIVEGAGTQVRLALPRATQPRVLVVDDNAAIQQLFERYLAPHHYEILHARSGPEALELAAARRPDAITLDVMMPSMDGWQVLRSLTADPATAHIPVIVCSVLKEPDLAFSLGARAYLKKPVDRLELVATLTRLVSPAAPGAAAPQPAPGDS